MWLLNPSQIVAAIIIDLMIGDPHGWPHEARFAGMLSTVYERWLTRHFSRSILLGLLFWFMVVGTMLAGYAVIHASCSVFSPIAGYLFDVFIIYQAIAAGDLHRHARLILEALVYGDLSLARKRLSYIVGRDTKDLDASEISRATIESVSESLVDGIVAPLFWTVVGGAPGALIYRVANTLDSIVGHRTPAYERFGKASARIDDLLNWVPARLCALVIYPFRHRAPWSTIRQEAAKHASPNAGWPEAAMAYALGVRLGGTNYYDGDAVKGPVFNASGRGAGVDDVRKSLTRIWRVVFVAGGVLVVIVFLTWGYQSPNTRHQRGLSDFVLKGLQDSAWGFNPWEYVHAASRPEGAEDIFNPWFVWSVSTSLGRRFYRPLWGGALLNPYQGLKFLAESCSPFGTEIAMLLPPAIVS
jgi:adenosylcobinamide-phosphate synthase